MKQKEGKMLRYRLGVSVLILIILSTGFISAADVIVKPGDLYVEGKVGIGTESPGAKLEIAQANAHPGLYINATTAVLWCIKGC